MIVCAIHQPNFFPWLGYFDKIRQADIFIFMDDVAYPKSGSGMGTWTNRVRLAIQGQKAWITCPIRRVSGEQRIRDVLIDDRQPWRRKLMRTLEMNYRRCPNYEAAMAVLEPLIRYEADRLAEFNINAITTLSRVFDLSCAFRRQSEMQAEGKATKLLINLTREADAGAYLCGGGAGGYQDDGLFAQSEIGLVFQSFEPRPYGDESRFLPGLSIIDYLMTCPSSLEGLPR